jgi:hypothetical protein
MTSLQRQILIECHRRQEALRLGKSPPLPGATGGDFKTRIRAARRRLDWEDEKKYGPKWNASEWGLGCSGAERKAAIRSVHRLCESGYTTGVLTGDRLTNLRLTEEGVKAARELLAAERAAKKAWEKARA